MFGRIVFGLVGIPLGLIIIIYTHYIVDNITGPIGFAERLFSSIGSGTYSFFRISGLIIIIASLMVMFGVGDWIYLSISSSLVGMGQGL